MLCSLPQQPKQQETSVFGLAGSELKKRETHENPLAGSLPEVEKKVADYRRDRSRRRPSCHYWLPPPARQHKPPFTPHV